MVQTLNEAIINKADKSYVDSKIPSVTIADAGKFLRVSEDGNWIVSSIARAEEESF